MPKQTPHPHLFISEITRESLVEFLDATEGPIRLQTYQNRERLMADRAGEREPRHGAILLLHGPTGTAFQRFYADGKYHGSNGEVLDDFDAVVRLAGTREKVIVVYEPEED